MRKFKKIFLVFLLALVLRLSLVFVAHHGDLNNNISWGMLATERGLSNFYESGDWPYSAPNQPPLTILTFAGLSAVWQAIDSAAWWLNNNFTFFYSPFIWFWETKGMDLLVKLPGIFADLGIAWLIYEYFKGKRKLKLGLKLSAIWLFNPVTWYNSAIWGQTDAVVNFLGLAAVIVLLRKRLVAFCLLFTICLLFKGSLLIFLPILLFAALRQRYSLGEWARAVIFSIITLAVASVWFHPRFDLFSWFFNLYKERILPGEIGYLSANAFNFWWLIDPGKVLDSITYLGISARVWGIVALSLGIAGVAYWLKKKISDKKIFFSLALISLVSFLFMTRIHERYLYPFFPYATMLLGLIPGMTVLYIVLSVSHLFNLYRLFWAPTWTPLVELINLKGFPALMAVVNILVFFYLLRHLKKAKV